MNEKEPTNAEKAWAENIWPGELEPLAERLETLLQEASPSVRLLLDRVNLDNRAELQEAVSLCEQHLSGEVSNIYLVDEQGRCTALEDVRSISVSDTETVGHEEDGSVFLHLKGLKNETSRS